ncbi:Response regulator receiver domain-containing protein [Sphingomonas laterariae]|uniref:Response regulator receiver domain-containing protein n=1 Tax=Edaphosphingomonas laterariae TaxID=861865 RepID=A0A239BIB9_9SPHN|nr:response regulator [Sphingomonas laterariae]SNS07429.1 Response regulator receiver domain-containing protein [Sphingomonas laterariae]
MRFGEKDRVIKRLLIVEDEPLVAFDNEHALVEAGYHIVATVDRVAAATAALRDGLVDLALVDVRLAGGDNGMDVARVALERGVPVLIVTATCPAEARALAIGCLAKPHSTRTLRAAIRVVEERLRGATPKRLPAGLALFDAEG